MQPQRKPKETAPSRQDAEDLRALLATTVPIPPQQGEGGSDDDFMRPVATQGQELQPSDGQPSAPEADAAAGPSKLPAPKLWKAVPMATRKAVYAFMKGKLNGAQLKSPEGQAVVQETLAMFPPGSMDAAGVRTIFTQQRGKEQPAQAPAGTPAAAAGGTPQGPAAPAIAPGSAAAAPAELQKPGGLAAAAIAAGMQAAMAAAAQAPVPMPSNPPSKGPVPVGGTLQAGRMPTSTAQQVTQTAAQPLPAPAVALSGAPAQAPAASPAGQAQPVPGASAQPTAPPAAAAITRMSDDEIVKIGIKHGADEATLITILASPVANSSLYSSVVLRTLALAGPAGMSVQEMAFMAVQAGLATWDPSTSNVRNGLSRKTKLEHVAGIGNYKYALLCMPGVVETRQPKEPKVKAESAPSGSTATASLSNAAVPEAGVPLPAGAEQTDGAAENP